MNTPTEAEHLDNALCYFERGDMESAWRSLEMAEEIKNNQQKKKDDDTTL